MLLPLTITRRRGVDTLSFADGGLSDYDSPVLFRPELVWTTESVEALWRRILAQLPRVDLVRLDNMPNDVLGVLNPLALLANRDNGEDGHGTDLALCWSDIERRQGLLRRLKRHLRALERLGTVEMIVATTEAEIAWVLDAALRQKQARANNTRVRGLAADPARVQYFREASRVFHGIGQLNLAALTVDGEIVATSWGLAQGDRVYGLMMSFDLGPLRKYSCGRILNLMLLRWLKEHGYAYYDQGIGDESWKFHACDTHLKLRAHLDVRSWRGQVAVTLHEAHLAVRANPHWQRLRRSLHRPQPARFLESVEAD